MNAPASSLAPPKPKKSHPIHQLQAFWFTLHGIAPVTLPVVAFIAKGEKRAEARQ
jgi:hypothetical protein